MLARKSHEHSKVTLDHFKISPNPAYSKCDLIFFRDGKKFVTIYNLVGQPIQYFTLEGEDKILSVDLTEFKSGTYSVKVVYIDTTFENSTLTVIH